MNRTILSITHKNNLLPLSSLCAAYKKHSIKSHLLSDDFENF